MIALRASSGLMRNFPPSGGLSLATSRGGFCNGFLLHGASGATLGSSGIAPGWALSNLGASLSNSGALRERSLIRVQAPRPRGYEALSPQGIRALEALTLSGSHEGVRPYAPALVSRLPHPRRKKPLTLMAQALPPTGGPRGEGALAGLTGEASCLEGRGPTPQMIERSFIACATSAAD